VFVGGGGLVGGGVPGPTVFVGGTCPVAVGTTTWPVISTIASSDDAVVPGSFASLAIAWLEMRAPGVAVERTRTLIVIVAGSPLRALTLHVTVLPLTLQEPLLALGVPTISSCALIVSRTITWRGAALLLKTEIE
jgi:hypothetical protein